MSFSFLVAFNHSHLPIIIEYLIFLPKYCSVEWQPSIDCCNSIMVREEERERDWERKKDVVLFTLHTCFLRRFSIFEDFVKQQTKMIDCTSVTSLCWFFRKKNQMNSSHKIGAKYGYFVIWFSWLSINDFITIAVQHQFTQETWKCENIDDAEVKQTHKTDNIGGIISIHHHFISLENLYCVFFFFRISILSTPSTKFHFRSWWFAYPKYISDEQSIVVDYQT